MKHIKHYILAVAIVLMAMPVLAQQDVDKKLTKEQVLEMTTEELSALPLEELMQAIDVVGVTSMEELFELIMNKNVKSASKKVENAFDSPLSTTVLTRHEMETYGATSFEEALRLVPGVIVREKTNGNFDVHIRGLDNVPPKNMLLYSENQNTLVMINGRPVFNYAFGGTLWETLPIGFEDVDRIEVVRGPSSALYGPNAVTGVINFLTVRTDEETPVVSGSVQQGGQSTYIGNIGVRKKLNEKLSFGITSNFETRERSTSDIYIFDNNNNQLNGEAAPAGWYSMEEYAQLVDGVMGLPIKDPKDKMNELFEDINKAKEKRGVNAYIDYHANAKTSFSLSTGYQDSYVTSTTIGDNPTSFGSRSSNTGYADITARFGKLNLQTNFMGGTQNFAKGDEGFKQDVEQFNLSADYDLQIKALNIRPGISYQHVGYSDEKYVEAGKGYFNEKKVLDTWSANVRFDYLAFQKLRLVAAVRAEKYTYPEKWYPSWQFAGTLPINESNLVRVVYSRANRSSFMVNVHSDYEWNREGRLPPATAHFLGEEDHQLVSSDMIELGYRVKPAKNISVDLEAFYSLTKDFGALLTNQSTAMLLADASMMTPDFFMNMDNYEFGVLPLSLVVKYRNLDLEATQMGASLNIDWVVNPQLIIKMHGTVQKTTLDNYLHYSNTDLAEFQINDGVVKRMNALGEKIVGHYMQTGEVITPTQEEVNAAIISNALPTDEQDNVNHEATPSFWGSLGVIYRPTKKLELSSYGYYYGDQTFVNQYDNVDIDAKFIWNAQVSYKLIDNVSLFVNAKNILNDKSNEFAFMDEIGSLYLGGVRFNF